MSERKYTISTGKSRLDTRWKIKELTWGSMVSRLSDTRRTSETVRQYESASKDRRSEIKDVGGFVGGPVTGGRRVKEAVTSRSMLTLDIDYGDPDVWDDFCFEFNCAACMYSTHSHTPENNRFRLIIPLSRDVDTDEYQAIARKVAESVGINRFDDTTYQSWRLMYWPSTSKDGEYVFEEQKGDPLDADMVLGMYHDWRDTSQWPMSSRVQEDFSQRAKKQGEPTEKPGPVGVFCRAYDIHQAIEEFLSDIYLATDDQNRYTYAEGSSACGLVVYDDKFAYSHHATDPAGQTLCNAFDLVRIHLFGNEDKGLKKDVAVNSLPSYKKMSEFTYKCSRVIEESAREKENRIAEMYGDLTFDTPEDPVDKEQKKSGNAWLKEMTTDKNGNPEKTITNICLVLENAPGLKGNIKYNELSGKFDSVSRLPWRSTEGSHGQEWTDADRSQLLLYLEVYGLKDVDQKSDNALRIVAHNHKYHPVREYLDSLVWDGVNRVDTLFIDYLGAEDSRINRVMTRKTLTAAVARAYAPGTKFDQVLVLRGDEGCGKSEILKRLGGKWHCSSVIDLAGKEGMQQIQGSWIIEMPELVGIKRSEVEVVKGFITREVDEYRASYGKIKESHPRQCIIFTTTNECEFLKGDTGNRRFWVVRCMESDKERTKFPWEMTEHDVGQIWAEAVSIYKEGNEKLYLDNKEDLDAARALQEEHNDRINDPRIGMIQVFLERKLPVNHSTMDYDLRKLYFADEKKMETDGVMTRQRVCAAEILVECFGYRKKDITRYDVMDINSLMRQIPGWTGKEYRDRIYGNKVRGFMRIQGGKNVEDDEDEI